METIFYDGHCALCHGFVRFVVRRDHAGHFDFAPLAGDHFSARVSADKRRGLPDSVVLHAEDGRLLVKSAAVLHVLKHIGGIYSIAATGMAIFPAGFRDFFYDAIAGVRQRIFGTRKEVCPMLPPELQKRFRA